MTPQNWSVSLRILFLVNNSNHRRTPQYDLFDSYCEFFFSFTFHSSATNQRNTGVCFLFVWVHSHGFIAYSQKYTLAMFVWQVCLLFPHFGYLTNFTFTISDEKSLQIGLLLISFSIKGIKDLGVYKFIVNSFLSN